MEDTEREREREQGSKELDNIRELRVGSRRPDFSSWLHIFCEP